MLLLLGCGENFSNVFVKWPSEMFNFSFKFKVLTWKELCFFNCLCSIFFFLFRNCFQISIYLIHQYWNLKRQGLHCFWPQAFCLKFFAFQNKSNFRVVRSSACCTINSACSGVFLRSLTERYEVSDNALERGRFG